MKVKEPDTMWVASFHFTMYLSFESLNIASNCVDFPPMSPQDSWFAQYGYWDVFLMEHAVGVGYRRVSTPRQVENCWITILQGAFSSMVDN